MRRAVRGGDGGYTGVPTCSAYGSRRGARRIRTLVFALLAAAIAASALVSSARADGDPASDYLYAQRVFVPYDAGPNSSPATQLTALTKEANRKGYPIRVAVIASTYDLGSVTALWRKPALYARFLSTELSSVFKGRLLVVMPNGFGIYQAKESTSDEQRLLRLVPLGGTGSNTLTKTAIAAVQRLAAAAGHPLAIPQATRGTPRRPAPGRTATDWALVAVLALGSLVACLLLLAVGSRWHSRKREIELTQPMGVRHSGRVLLITLASAVTLGAITGAVLALTRTSASPSGEAGPAGYPKISAATVNLMGLVPLQPPRTAPLFTLVDQRDQRVSLASLHGRVIVLEFMDSRCTNLCPIISHEYALAAKRLASTTSEVEFVAVNVNARHAKVSDVAAFSRKYGLESLPHWHFLTGPPNVLKRVWKAYGVSVYDTPSAGVVHGVDMYFIDDQSRMRWVASPGYDQALIARWGNGIATVVRSLLPS